MSRSPGVTMARRAGALLATALLAAGAALGGVAGQAAGATRVARDGPSPASRSTVLQGLGVSAVPAELIFLVDVSDSMSPAKNNLYPTVRQKVLDFMGALAQEDPQDLVGVILFSKPSANQVFQPGPPDPNFWLPETPQYTIGTDLGFAFHQAVEILSQAPSTIKVGGVLLLSDGQPYAPKKDDPVYGGNGFSAPGWNALRVSVGNLPMTVTGYDVPLTNNTSYTANQHAALSKVFPSVQTLPGGASNLGAALDQAKLKILDSKVVSAASPDNGRGVQVSWGGLPGAGGPPLDLKTGHADVTVTVTARTHRVPLYLSGLSVTATGLPVTMKANLPASQTLAGGQSKTWHVRLTWAPRASGLTWSGRARTVRGHLVLKAAVASSYTPTLRSAYGYTAFSVGGLSGGESAEFPATTAAQWSLLDLLVILLLLVALLTVVAGGLSWMSGVLVLTSVDEAGGEVWLRGPRQSVRTDRLVDIPGRLIVRGSPLHPGGRRMRVTLRLNGRPPSSETLRSGGRTMAAGIDIVHYPRSRHPARPRAGSHGR